MKRILVGVDGSDVSNSAAQFAASLARTTGAELVLASSAELPLLMGMEAPGEALAQAFDAASAAAASALATTSALLALNGTTAKTIALEGPAAEALAELAKGEVDLVVVGHRSRNLVSRMMLGSVANRLVQICSRPVLVYR